MNDLTKKVKESLVKTLMEHKDIDEKYLIIGNEFYSRREIAEEIKNETEFGIKMLEKILLLSLDLLSRDKV